MTVFNEEWEKMLRGERYDAMHPEFHNRLAAARDLLWEFNSIKPSNTERLDEILRQMLGGYGERFHVNPPFRCDYGCNIFIGEDFFANFNLTILDEAKVTIGSHAFIGPNVSIYTACHPLEPDERKKFVEWAEGVTIGNNVWIGGSAVILPGVTIGDNVVIGAGSVVVKNIPDNSVAVGNPCRVIRPITDADRNTCFDREDLYGTSF